MVNSSIVISRVDYRRLLDVLDDTVRGVDEAVLQLLDRKLEHARHVDPQQIPAGVVTMNSRLEYRRLTGGATKVASLVYPADADAKAKRVSVLSQLGAMLLGAREGDVLDWGHAQPLHRVRVERLHYQPEAAGDWQR